MLSPSSVLVSGVKETDLRFRDGFKGVVGDRLVVIGANLVVEA